MQSKRILILTTGGTIAGSGNDVSCSANYQAGAISGSSLLSALPKLPQIIEAIEIAQIDSIEMTSKIWESLLDTIFKQYDNYDGFVITHGTDTMEESSFVLNLLYRREKPIVFVGSMRPNNAIGSDGVKNLCNAIALASAQESRGAMVLMNDKIYNPNTIYKAHTYNLDSFDSRNGGEMGYVLDSCVRFFYRPKCLDLPFNLGDLKNLARVEVLYIYAGIEDLPQWSNLQGLVIAGCGAGNLPIQIRQKLKILQEQGVPIIASSRGSKGFVLESEFIPSFGLSVAKARILLALCLSHFSSQRLTSHPQQIREIFSLF